MLEINCNMCENLADKATGCKLYGADPATAAKACRANLFINYTPRRTKDEKLTPGQEVWVVERDECGNACEVVGYVYLATVAHAVILTPYINDLDELTDILDYHIEETQNEYDTHLTVFRACDCYPNKLAARCALKTETED